MPVDLGDVVALAVTIRDSAGDPANATTVTCTISAPDGTTTAAATANPATGTYTASFTPTLSGPHGVRWLATGENAASFHDGFYVTAPSIPLVSLADIKTHLNIPLDDTGDDEELRTKLAAAHDAVSGHLKRPVTRTNRTDVLPAPPRSASLVLPLPDVASVVSVTANGVTLDPSDYWLDARAGVLIRPAGWGVGPVTVVWVTKPVETADVRTAVAEMCRHLWDTQRGSAKSLPRAGGDMTPSAGYSLPNRVVELLAPYRARR